MNSDNRASITINTNPTQTFTLSLGSLASGIASRGRLIELDNTQVWGTGVLARQDPTAFSTAAIGGDWAFGFGGTAYSGFPLETAGRFTASEGSLTAGHADTYGVGLTESGADTVIPQVNVPFAGVYAVSSNGRGTATLSGLAYSNFSFYVVSANELLFIELEVCGPGPCYDKSGISGMALRQSGGPFSTNSLKGTSVFSLTTGVAVGSDVFDGVGGVAQMRDDNGQGTVVTGPATNGTYSLDSDGLGRGTMSLQGSEQPMAFYMVSPGKAFLMDLASSTAGAFEPQTPGPFNNASLAGSYTLGTLPKDWDWDFDWASGVLIADGAGNLTATTDSKGGTGVSSMGSYSVAANGRATMSITSSNGSSSNWVFYLASPSKAVGIDVTTGATSSPIRVLEK